MSIRITIDGDDAVIRIPRDRCHAVRVALRPRLAGDLESEATKRTREALDKALARVEEQG